MLTMIVQSIQVLNIPRASGGSLAQAEEAEVSADHQCSESANRDAHDRADGKGCVVTTAGILIRRSGVLGLHAGARGCGEGGHVLRGSILFQQSGELARCDTACKCGGHLLVRHATAGRHLHRVLHAHGVREDHTTCAVRHAQVGGQGKVGAGGGGGAATGGSIAHYKVLDGVCGGAHGSSDGGDEDTVVRGLISDIGGVRHALDLLWKQIQLPQDEKESGYRIRRKAGLTCSTCMDTAATVGAAESAILGDTEGSVVALGSPVGNKVGVEVGLFVGKTSCCEGSPVRA